MRLFKDEHELAVMRRAGQISSAAHVRAMKVAAPGKREYEVEAELVHEFIRNGARSAAYGSIVAAGANACVLHYRDNSAELRRGELMLIDAGCELDSYASDITRTFPIAARFTAVQRDVYELVLASQEAAIKAVKPGADFIDYHDAATRVLVQGFIDFKLCKGSVDAVLEAVLHAPHRPLAGAGRARRRRLHAKGKVAQVEGRHGAHGRARLLHPPRRQRAQGLLEHRRAHRGRRSRHAQGARGPHRRVPEEGEGRRGRRPRPLMPLPRSAGSRSCSAKRRQPID
jgi:methionine aminopeptidase